MLEKVVQEVPALLFFILKETSLSYVFLYTWSKIMMG